MNSDLKICLFQRCLRLADAAHLNHAVNDNLSKDANQSGGLKRNFSKRLAFGRGFGMILRDLRF